MPKVKKIRLMTDYGCWPLWHVEGKEVGNINPVELPLSTETIGHLLRWAKAFDNTINLDDPKDESRSFSAQELEELEQEGISLWQRIQEELAPNYEVLYRSQTLNTKGGSEVVVSCLYEPLGASRPYQLIFKDCHEVRWQVIEPGDVQDSTADLIGFSIGTESHR